MTRPMHVTRRRLTLGVAVLLAAASALAVPQPPSADAATTTTLRGTVVVAGRAVAGVPVGTWSPTSGTLATTTTDARGRFTLHSPATSAVVAWVGRRPSSEQSVFTAGDDHLVRGVIGRAAPRRTASALVQRVTPVRPSRLGGGHALRFRLLEAGRFSAHEPLLGDFGDETDSGIFIDHAGASATSLDADATGTIRSGWLAPGRYHLLWAPHSPYVQARSTVVVRAGEDVRATSPAFRKGGSITVHATVGGEPVAAGIPAAQRFDGQGLQGAPSTDDTGSVVEERLSPGTYAITVGRRYVEPYEIFDGAPTSDVVLPKTVTVRITGSEHVTRTVDLAPAGRITGTATGPDGALRVVVENASNAVVVRQGTVENGAFALGGLPGGTYRVLVANLASSTYDAETVVVPEPTASSTPVALPRTLVPHLAMPTLRGRVSGGRPGTIDLRSTYPLGTPSLASAEISRRGAYRVRTVPGSFRATIRMTDHVRRTVANVDVPRSASRDFAPGARYGDVTARLIASGRPLRAELLVSSGPGVEPLELEPAGGPGRVAATGLTPDRYSILRVGTIPALDGPWTYRVTERTFAVHAGTVTRLGRIAVTVSG